MGFQGRIRGSAVAVAGDDEGVGWVGSDMVGSYLFGGAVSPFTLER